MAKKASVDIIAPGRWLILGSFPAEQLAEGLLANRVAGEEGFAPSQGQRTAGKVWRQHPGPMVDFLDAKLAFDPTEWCFAYAFTYVHAPQAENVRLLAGSDDGIALWVNGKQVHWNNVHRGVSLDEDVAPASLKKGWNRLLVKVSQGSQDWAFVVRIARPGGAKGQLAFSLARPDVAAGAGEAAAPLMAQATGPLAVEPTADGLAVAIPFKVYSDTHARTKSLRASVVTADGQTLASMPLADLPAYGSTEEVLRGPGSVMLNALASGVPLKLVIASPSARTELPIPAAAAAQAFLSAMTGLETRNFGPGATLPVPPLYRGQEALVEVAPARFEKLLSVAVVPKDLAAQQEIPAEQTAGESIPLDLPIAPEIADPLVRVTFGDAKLRETISAVRVLAYQMAADLHDAVAEARQGLAAVAADDFPAAAAAMEALLHRLAAQEGDRRDQNITLVGHAHIDMNWLWTSAETRQVTHDTFRQVLSFMEEFPQFTFSQSQSATYQYIEHLDAAMFEQIRRRVAEGRWEVLGGMVDEGDTNLSSGEGIARSMLLGQKYFLSRFGRRATVGWLPDNFGHAGQLPQLLQLAGMGSFYAHRCQPQKGPFLWEGVDGTRVVNYVTPTYNGEVTPVLRKLPEQFDPVHKKLVWIYGVGDHGGGPTRRDITRAVQYDKTPGFPAIRFGTAGGFFETLRDDRASYPVYRGELQVVFPGCYTSIARIKEGNRRCENSLYSAELLSGLMGLYGHAGDWQQLAEAWHGVAFNQFHDILCGSATHDSNRESIARYDRVLEQAQEAQYGAMRYLAARVETRADLGQPVVVVNPLPKERTDAVEAEIFSYVPPPTAQIRGWGAGGPPDPKHAMKVEPRDLGHGPYATIKLTDAEGNAVPAQVVDGKGFPHGHRLKVRFMAKDMPACGYRVYYATPAEAGTLGEGGLKVDQTGIESPLLKVELNPKTGHVRRIYDKRRRKEVLSPKAAGNLLKIYMEKPHGMSAWDIGPITAVHNLDQAVMIKVVEHGPVRATIEVWRQWGRSTFIQRVSVHRDLPRVDFELDVRWFELGSREADAPMLRVSFPLHAPKGKFVCDTPFAAIERPSDGREVPAQKWTDLSGARGGAALLNDSKYGHRCDQNALEMTLLRASYEPDAYPEQGPHLIRYSLLPHGGGWRAGNVVEEGLAFNLPLLALETPPGQAGGLAGGSLLNLSPANVQLSAVKKAHDDGDLVVRLWECFGQATEATLTLPRPRGVQRVNILEEPLADAAPARLEGNTIRLAVLPKEIVTLKIAF